MADYTINLNGDIVAVTAQIQRIITDCNKNIREGNNVAKYRRIKTAAHDVLDAYTELYCALDAEN